MTDGFDKITVDPPNDIAPQIVEKHMRLPKKYIMPAGVILGVLVIFLLITLYLSRGFYNSLKSTLAVGKEVSASIKTQNIEEAKVKLAKLDESFKLTQGSYNKLGYLKIIPIVGSYYNDGYHLINAGINGVEAGLVATDALVPYADLLGLKGKGTFTGGSADQRIQTAVQTLDKVTPKLKDISAKIELIKKDLDQVDPNRYPEKIGNTLVRSRLTSLVNIFDDSANLFVNAQPLLEELPKVLGEPDPKRYLVLFQNDKELRATGGFITGYAIFKVEHGKLNVEKADDIYKLDDSKNKKFPAPPEILKYHKGVYTLELRDSNLSPDFTVSMDQFKQMLKSVSDFPKYDGIVAIDTHVLVEAIKILGPIPAYGSNFTAENDKRCNCPNVIYELESYADKPVAYEKGSRKDIIGVLLYQIMQKALGVSPGKYWGSLFQMAISEMEQKHILFYLNDAKAQNGLSALNFSGQIKATSDNYLHVNDVNFAGAKSNMFVKESVKYDLRIEGGVGTVILTIDYKNPSPPSDCGLESGGLCLNGLLRNWLRIYVPKGSKLLDFKGSEMDTLSYDSLEKTVFEGFLTVKPMGASQAVIHYKLPFKFENGKAYSMLIQKQPGTDEPVYTILVNGRKIDEFPLTKDQVVKFNL